jgi:hypothetical protein
MLSISQNASTPASGDADGKFQAILRDLKCLSRNFLWVILTIGYATQTFFAGAVAVFGINYIGKVGDSSSYDSIH